MASKTETEKLWRLTDGVSIDGKPDTLEAFFISKLGNSGGKRLFKEVFAFAKDKLKPTAGDPALLLGAKGGKVVGVKET